MRRIEFSPEVWREIERDRFRHLHPAVQRRMQALWLKANGEKHQRIAELAGWSRPTVQRLLDLCLAGGLAAVRTFHWKVPLSALEPHRPLVEAEFRQRPPHTVAEACERSEQPEPDRAALEIHQEGRFELATPAMFWRFPARDRQVPRRAGHPA